MLRIRTTRINQTDETIHMIVLSNGNFARTTNGEIFKTPNKILAEQSLEFIQNPDRKSGSHIMKSIFGIL